MRRSAGSASKAATITEHSGRSRTSLLGSAHALAAGQILIGQRVFGAVEGAIDAASVGELELKGFGRAVPAYDVRGLRRADG